MKHTEASTTQDFRLFLQEELLKRCRVNPQFSLRAFAKILDVSPSALSAMINGKRPITEKSKQLFGLKLGLNLQDLKLFIPSSKRANDYAQLTLDSFALISDWYHYAILELLSVKGFQSDASWVAKRLGITKSQVNIAIERLERLEMIEIDKKGNWKDISSGFTTNIEEGLTSSASKKFQEQVLEKALVALQNVPLEKRDHTSMTIAINTKDLPEAKKLLKEFRRSFNSFLSREGSSKADEVYNLSLALYPLSQNIEGDSI